jgi:hypothetical protein
LVQKLRLNLISNTSLERALFLLQKSSLNVLFHFSSDIKKNNKKEKMILRDGEVARTFLEVFGFWLFLLLRFVLDKYVWYKVCTSDIALSNKKKFNWFRSWQYGLIESDICAKTFAPHVI